MSDFAYPFSVNLDGSGNGRIDLTQFFVDSWYQVFNIGMSIPGAGLQQVQLLLGNVPYQQGQGASPQLGPIYLHSQSCVISIVGGTANGLAQGYVQGAEETNYNDLPNLSGPSTNNVSINGGTVDLTGPVSITGPVNVENTNPALLLAGQVGDPLVENQSFTVPNRTLNPNFVTFPNVGSFDVGGYGALFIIGDPNVSPPNLPSLWMQIEWFDSLGNSVSITQIDSLVPAFSFVIGCQGRKCSISIFNQDNVNHGVGAFSVIPLVSIPQHPELLLGNIGTVFGTFNPSPKGAIIDFTISLAPGSLVENGSFIWPGRAIWNVGLISGVGSTNYNSKLSCFDAFGNETVIARVASIALPPPMEVVLTSGLAQVTYVNTGAASTNVFISLMAAS